MLMQTLRRNLARQEGQALVLACLMVLVLTIAVLTTVNIGHTVHEKIRLQNNADATAYSMAAMEARAFNFYAFANRTQVSHYVGAMVWQSLDSFIFFLEAFLTDIFGIMVTVDKCPDPPDIFWEAACPILENLPYVGPVIKFIDKAILLFGDVIKAVQGALKNDVVDKFLAWGVQAHRIMNQVMDSASAVMMYSAMQHIADPVSTAMGDVSVIAAGVAAKNDPNLGKQEQQIPLAYLNACYFDRAHFREAGGSPFVPADVNPFKDLDVTKVADGDKTARAKVTMGQISNATRFGCDTSNGFGPLSALCPDGFVTDRRLGSFLPKLNIFGTNVLNGLVDFLNTFPVWGQTRMLTYGLAFGKDGYKTNPPGAEFWKKKGFCTSTFKYKYQMNRIREKPSAYNHMGVLAQGDNIGADDIYSLTFPPKQWTGNFPPAPFSNPFTCGENDDWRFCWGDNRVWNDKGDNKYTMPMKTSVWALNDTESPKGVHWRIELPGVAGPHTKKDDYTKNYGLNKLNKCAGLKGCPNSSIGIIRCPLGVEVGVYAANVEPRMEDWHKWNGVVRFPHFEPGQYANACGQSLSARGGDPSTTTAAGFANDQGNASGSPGDFNQPSEWVMFHKSPEDMRNPLDDPTGATRSNPALLNDTGELTFHFTPAGAKVTLEDKEHDGNTRQLAGLPSGVTAISRAQTYYHRPGNWAEQPNFFNPYWRPRLASVWQGRKTLPFIGDLVKKLPGALKTIPQKVITH